MRVVYGTVQGVYSVMWVVYSKVWVVYSKVWVVYGTVQGVRCGWCMERLGGVQ
jgi:hypothetical protein